MVKKMNIKGLIFDFDGLILDTETPDVIAWKQIYAKYGHEFDFFNYAPAIGAVYEFNQPADSLTQKIPNLKRDIVMEEWYRLKNKLIKPQAISSGIPDYLLRAKELSLKIAIASSSTYEWVVGHLQRLGIKHFFNSIHTADQTGIGKPDPALYLLALKSLKIHCSEALAFEDSPNGITAAQSAGIFCIAIPNPITKKSNISHADLILNSLIDMTLDELINLVRTK